MRLLAERDGYIAAAAQEVCLQLFGGPALAAQLDRASDTFRQQPPNTRGPTRPPAAEHAPDPPAPDAAFAHAQADPAADRPASEPDPAAADAPLAAAACRVAGAERARGRGRRGGRGRGQRPREPGGTAVPPEPECAPIGGTQRERGVVAAEAGLRAGLASLDDVSLEETCRVRVLTLQAAPQRLRGALRTALRTGLPRPGVRRWSACGAGSFSCLRPACCCTVRLESAVCRLPSLTDAASFSRLAIGWNYLVRPQQPLVPAAGAPRGPPLTRHVRTGLSLSSNVASCPRQARALTAEPLAEGSPATLAELTDPDRPPEAYGPHDADVLGFQPDQPCAFPQQAFVACLQSGRHGSAAGPGGATNEHLRIMLDHEEDSRLLHNAAELRARAQVPDDVLAAVRVGRVVALQKPNGRVRALVVGDVLRRLVGRVLAQQFGPQFQEACLPFQIGLSTSAGTEAVVCLLPRSN